MSWQERLQKWGFCSQARLHNREEDDRLGDEMKEHAKQQKMAYECGLMCHSIFPSYSKTTWTDEKLSQPRKKR